MSKNPEVKGRIRVMSKEEIIDFIESAIGKIVICDFEHDPHIEKEGKGVNDG